MKRNAFNCLLKEAREVAVVILVGRLHPDSSKDLGAI